MKVSDALVLSLNLPFVQLLQRYGVPRFGALLRSMACLRAGEPDESYGLGLAIGNAEVTLLDLVGAYGCLARGGTWRAPCLLRRELAAAERRPETRVFSEGACWLVAEMLSGGARSQAALGHIADVNVSRFAWKTGTSSAYRDAWTVAWNPEYVIGVWCGHKSGNFGDTALVGAAAAAPYAWEIARALYPANDGPWYAKPETVVARTVCAESGLTASAACPRTEEGRAIRGVSSFARCPVHRLAGDGTVETRRDAFLDAYTRRAEKAEKLEIRKPQDNSEFRLVKGLEQQRIVCAPVGNVPDGRLWWFVDGAYAGETRGGASFAWRPAAGAHRITCSTDDGVTASVRVTVTEE